MKLSNIQSSDEELKDYYEQLRAQHVTPAWIAAAPPSSRRARPCRTSGTGATLIIEGTGGYTVVNGERIPMAPGDLVLTQNWTWHDHAK